MFKSIFFKLTSKNKFWWFVLVLVSLVLFIPALNIKFWWIDDGMSITMAQKILSSLNTNSLQGLSVILQEQGGRFRTIYWIYQTLVYVIGGTNPTIHFAIHFLVITVAAIYIYEIVKFISKSNTGGIFAAILYIVTPLNTENIYRLGPIEPILALCGIASLYYLVIGKIKPAVVFLFLTTFLKETGFVIWIPVLIAYLVKRIALGKRDNNYEKYVIWGILFFALVLLNITSRHSGYSTNYVFDLSRITSNLTEYLKLVNNGFKPFLSILLISYLLRICNAIRNKSIKKQGTSFIIQGLFLVSAISYLAVQLPWEYVIERYTMPMTIGLSVFVGLESAHLFNGLLRVEHWIARVTLMGVLCYFVIFSASGVIRIYKQGERFVFTTNFIQELYTYLSTNIPEKGVVLLNFLRGDSTLELVDETGIHLSVLYNRPDIKVSYLDLDNLPKSRYLIVGTPAISEEYAVEQIENKIGNYVKAENIVHEKKFLVITTPNNLLKQIVKKISLAIIKSEPLNSDGIYTYFVMRDYWYKYDVN